MSRVEADARRLPEALTSVKAAKGWDVVSTSDLWVQLWLAGDDLGQLSIVALRHRLSYAAALGLIEKAHTPGGYAWWSLPVEDDE